ncbi:uncharacterized protein LOC142336826 [Convolutriloba macropyga]|uniref:uncharacterized protein LOC142336826 n=1 Tax=Convolutriloba macropyga TaxID=536237 RepID=UPI003F520D20
MKKYLLSLLFSSILATLISSEKETPLATRGTQFNEPRPNTRLDGFQIESFQTPSRMTCGVMCTQNPFCISYNYCSGKVCQLNSEDVHTQMKSAMIDARCIYKGMTGDTQPHCLTKNGVKNIQDDNDPGVCLIHQKRRDEVCSEWAYFESWIDARSDDKKEFAKYGKFSSHENRSSLRPPFHGGGNCGPLKRNVRRFETPGGRSIYSVAKQACADIGGHLFDRLDGTVEQIEFLCSHFVTYNMWFGLEKSSDGIFRDREGNNMNAFISGATLESNPSDIYLIYSCHTWSTNGQSSAGFRKYFYDEHQGYTSDVICDML